jgi:hypothetical protein
MVIGSMGTLQVQPMGNGERRSRARRLRSKSWAINLQFQFLAIEERSNMIRRDWPA